MRSGLLLAVVLGGTSGVVADTLHVPGDFPTIQEAIDAAMDGDEVEVHPGTYNETINFLGKAITVRSSDAPDVTTIDATGLGQVSVVTCNSGEGPNTVLDGFTVTGGGPGMLNLNSSPTVTNCTFSGNGAGVGGGMYNSNSSPMVTNCTFSGNGAFVGGGMYNDGSSPTVTNCTFSGNTASAFFGGGGVGGGMYNLNSSPTVTNCTFSGNLAVGDAGVGGGGGGMFNFTSNPSVTNCTFSGNVADFDGGGMSNIQSSSPTVTNCTFSGNTAGFDGGGMYNIQSSSPTVTNCTFTGNTAGFDGGGLYNEEFSSPTVTNCILWGDTNGEIGGDPANVNYSCIQGGYAGTGNIDADPLFVAPGIGDFRLSSGSPAIDAGNNWGVPIDANDYDEDGILCELFPVDLDGNARFNADEADFDPGCGVPVVVDMGAYEYQFDPADQVTFADLNGDGAVGVKDLLGLLGSWGPCAKGCCLADLDLDGNVGVKDLLILLGVWGPCP